MSRTLPCRLLRSPLPPPDILLQCPSPPPPYLCHHHVYKTSQVWAKVLYTSFHWWFGKVLCTSLHCWCWQKYCDPLYIVGAASNSEFMANGLTKYLTIISIVTIIFQRNINQEHLKDLQEKWKVLDTSNILTKHAFEYPMFLIKKQTWWILYKYKILSVMLETAVVSYRYNQTRKYVFEEGRAWCTLLMRKSKVGFTETKLLSDWNRNNLNGLHPRIIHRTIHWINITKPVIKQHYLTFVLMKSTFMKWYCYLWR